MGIIIFKIFIWGGVSSVLWSEITFDGSADALPSNKIYDHKTNDIPPQMKILNTVIPSIYV